MITVSILAPDLPTLRARALAQIPFADAIELRLDNLALAREADLTELIRALEKPVIAAVNAADAFGTFSGTRAERFDLLARAARAGAAYIDIDWKEAAHQPPLPTTTRRIVSRHIQDETPTDLKRAFDALALESHATDRLKFVTHAHRAEDGARMLEFLSRQTRETIAFTSGERGSFTRVLAPIFGSQSTYAAPAFVAGVDTGGATAPGQIRADTLRAQLPATGLTRDTEIFAVLGNPARHSLSPRLHTAVFRNHNRNAVYVAIEPDDIGVFLAHAHAPNWRGFSVTAPFKEPAFALATERDEHARASSAANTLIRAGATWNALNTDVGAVEVVLRRALQSAELEADLATALVIGTGGAARAALTALRRAKLGERSAESAAFCVTGRTESKVKSLAREFGATPLTRDEWNDQRFDILVHCTPAGSHVAPNEMPIPLALLKSARAVIEAVYRPTRTPLVQAAERAGVEVVLGTAWFLEQAALQAQSFGADESARPVLFAELERALAEARTA
ncbi:MAG: type I 3-dehydroquinate dehydratase [Planctomycetes bacterium]|nr:type I 3-dehydroquinate dehydratase [Planctomycetota bacterium]